MVKHLRYHYIPEPIYYQQWQAFDRIAYESADKNLFSSIKFSPGLTVVCNIHIAAKIVKAFKELRIGNISFKNVFFLHDYTIFAQNFF